MTDLDLFTRGYIDAMFFTECHSDNPELEYATFDDLSENALELIKKDCAEFLSKNSALLDAAISTIEYDLFQAGCDYWFTRNGHGVGFWDRNLGEIGDQLSDAARYSEVYLYKGDDGKLYI
jgi:hypothetical protein